MVLGEKLQKYKCVANPHANGFVTICNYLSLFYYF